MVRAYWRFALITTPSKRSSAFKWEIAVREFRANITSVCLSLSSQPGLERRGLGLTITNRIIQEHHGEILFETGSGGTVFNIELPL